MKDAAAACLGLILAASCGDPQTAHVREPESGFATPSRFDGDRTCADVADVRVCWGAGDGKCAGDVCLLPRPVPTNAPSLAGWRCVGTGDDRRCSAREHSAGPFECMGAWCEQRYPRLPGDGRWECSDFDGIAVCRAQAGPAGVAAVDRDAGWICGRRRGAPADEICIDPSPDLPGGATTGYRCLFAHEQGERRRCERDPSAVHVADPCDVASPCVQGAVCAGGRCLPRRLRAECWLDADCDGACRFGTCMGPQ